MPRKSKFHGSVIYFLLDQLENGAERVRCPGCNHYILSATNLRIHAYRHYSENGPFPPINQQSNTDAFEYEEFLNQQQDDISDYRLPFQN